MQSTSSGVFENELSDHEWHQVQIQKKNASALTLFVDDKTYFIAVPGFYSRLFNHQNFYLGGVNESRIKTRHWSLRKRQFVSYEGCLDKNYVKIYGIKLIDFVAWKGIATVSGTNARLICGCNITPGGYHPVTFPNPGSFIKVVAPKKNTAVYSFRFRTYYRNGTLLFQRITGENHANIFISLESGMVKLEVKFMGKSRSPPLYGGSGLDDGMWHSVAVNISIQGVLLDVDQKHYYSPETSRVRFKSSSEVFVGDSRNKRLGFVGCMRDLTIQGQRVNFTNVYRSHVLLAKCSLTDRCLPNPCQNNGRCSQSWKATSCDCMGTDFKGRKCETPAFAMQSCADWWAAGKRTNAYYKINPQHRETSFTVYCNLTDVKGPSAMILHTEDRNQVIAAQNKVGGTSYQHGIIYENSNEQNIKDLIASSTHCRQYLRYRCYNSVLFDSPKTFNLESGRGARWVSRDGKLQDYWSGAFPGSRKCACGVNRTCDERNKTCNCDSVDNKWHSDGGYLTDSASLPVKKLIFSVDGTSLKSYFVLGSLECYGSTTVNATKATTLSASHTTPIKSTEHKAKSPSTMPTTSSKGRSRVTKIQNTAISTPQSTLLTRRDASSTESHLVTSRTNTPTTNISIIVIETPRKYITIRENANQQLVLIILSVILAIFVIAIAVLIIKQNLLYPCKCLQTPLYHDVRHMDTIELGPPSPAEPEILQFETSPYPVRNNCDMGLHDCRVTLSPELYSDAETDRLDISNVSSLWNSENADIGEQEPEKIKDYEDVDLAIISVVPFPACKELSTEQQIMKLKEVIYDALTAADVKATYSDKNDTTTSPIKRYKDSSQRKSEAEQSLLHENEKLIDSDSESAAPISEISSEVELCSIRHAEDNERKSEEYCDESSKEDSLTKGKNGIDNDNWRSSDPHDNYLSLDVNNLQEGITRQALDGTNLIGDGRYNEQTSSYSDLSYPQAEQINFPACYGEKTREMRSPKEDKRNHSAPRPRLFSRQKSEEEALLSSAQINGQKQTTNNGSSDSEQTRYSGIAYDICQHQRKQQQRQQPHAYNKQSDMQSRGRNNKNAIAMPLKQLHSQRYETEL